MPVPPLRRSCRALLVDDEGKVLLQRHVLDHGTVWAAPGGLLEPGEDGDAALVRSVRDAVGLRLAPGVVQHLVWIQTVDAVELGDGAADGLRDEVYLVRVPRFSPLRRPRGHAGASDDAVTEARWWSREEIGSATRAGERFSPRDLHARLLPLLESASRGVIPSPVAIEGL